MEQTGLAGSSSLTIFWMLVAVAVVALVTKRIRLPYVVALVIAGLIIALFPGMPTIELTPDLILAVFLPLLVFEAAYNLQLPHLRENWRMISALAIPGVLLTAGVVGVLVHFLAGFDWPIALLFGAIVSATDPVSVVSTFKALGAPLKLRTIIEGESLFNDGTSLVLFRVLLGVVIAGQFDVAAGVAQFAFVIAGGVLVGLILGFLVSYLTARFDDYLVETVLTLILAYGAYFLAEELHVSGVTAVVAAGLLVGNYGAGMSFSPTTQVSVSLSWEFFGFLANSLIFLLVGLQVHLDVLAQSLWYVLAAIVAVLLSRIITVGGVSAIFRALRLPERAPPFSWQAVMVWGGLRGAVSLAMALSLPFTLSETASSEGVAGAIGIPFPQRTEIIAMTFGVILFTLLVQGLTLTPLMKQLRMIPSEDQLKADYNRTLAQLRATQEALATLTRQGSERHSSLLVPGITEELKAQYVARERELVARLEEIDTHDGALRENQRRSLQRYLLTVVRNTLRQLTSQGDIDARALRDLMAEIDRNLADTADH
ncbi:MAG: Na+/H+ antiporter [Chloroflexia bacterium]